MPKLLGSLAVVSALVLTSCASAEDVADSASETTSAEETTGSTTSPTSPASPTSTTSAPTETSASSPTVSSAPTSTPPTTTETQEPQLAAKPKVGTCYNTSKAQFRNQRDGSSPVDCSRRHTAETFAVFSVSSFPTKRDTDKVWRDCQPRFQRYVGDAATLSKLDLTVILPSIEQTSAGQAWIRCDAIQKANYNTKVGVARSGSLPRCWPRVSRGSSADASSAGRRSTRPSTSRPATPATKHSSSRSRCSSAVRTRPSPASPAQRRSKQFCEDVFQTYVPETLNYYYYHPTASSWKSGSHNSTCWALDTRGDGLPPL